LLSTIFALVILVWAVVRAIRQIRDNRRRGIGMQWPKTLTTAAGSIAVALVGITIAIAGVTSDHEIAGLIGCMAVIVGGVIALGYWVNRHWPTPR
jgi:hypothetical protein